jgi:HNH endonuclease
MRKTPLKRTPFRRKSSKVKTHVTRDGRLILSVKDWQAMKRRMWDALTSFTNFGVQCAICHGTIKRYEDFEPDHVVPRGMGGGKRDDSNIQPSHALCNRLKGSKRDFHLTV